MDDPREASRPLEALALAPLVRRSRALGRAAASWLVTHWLQLHGAVEPAEGDEADSTL